MPNRTLMRASALALATAALAAAIAPAAFAQGASYGTPGLSEPSSNKASNIDSQDSRSSLAPALPEPDVGPNAGPEAYLRAARAALATGRTGEAQQAMEMAETRLLDRSTPLFQTDKPSSNPAVDKVNQALQALGQGDRARSMQYLDQAIPLAAKAP
ncbi:MAG: hypothetical protein JSR21_21325 [Proteobacteria bacterium]|nr:hypothetical protein [Pseudomonadota bacterium]